jgi:alcohol dehydrogenase class IV
MEVFTMAVEMTQAAPVLFGVGAIQEVGNRMKAMGSTKVLCVYDAGVKATGLSAKIENTLKAAGLVVATFDKVKPDTPDYLVDEGGALARREQIDGVVVIGGGSSIDTAKGIRILITNPGSIKEYLLVRNGNSLIGGTSRLNVSTPMIAIPTTSGTGSEVTRVGVITDTETNYKDTIINSAVSLAILDPEVTLTLPPYATAATSMDAFAHAAESMTTSVSNPKTEVLGLAAISRITKWLPVAIADGSNLEARTELALASSFAGMAMCDGVAHMGHNIAHMLGQEYHIDHGTACAIGLPECMAHVAAAVPDVVKKIGLAMGLRFKAGANPREIGETVADGIRALMKTVGIKSLKDFGYTREDVIAAIAPLAKKEKALIALCAQPVTEEDIDIMVANSYDKYQ